MKNYRFWIFHLFIIHKELKFKYEGKFLTIGDCWSRFSVRFRWSRFELATNYYHFFNPKIIEDMK